MSDIIERLYDSQARLHRAGFITSSDNARDAVKEITTLREQVEKLTEAYDQCGRTVQDYGRTIDQTESRLCEVAAHCANVEQQLATLAEQNEKLRKVLLRLACLGNGDQYGNSIGNCIAQEALSLPNLATPVLNRIRAEGMRMAAEIVENTDVYTFVHGGSCYDDGVLTLSSAAPTGCAPSGNYEERTEK